MSFIKHSFGVAVDESYIYLIGGFNFRDGALKKCEKISSHQFNLILMIS